VVARAGTVFAATGLGWESLLSGEDAARVPARAWEFTPDGSRRCESRKDEATRACSGSEGFEDSSTNPLSTLDTAHEFSCAENRFEISGFGIREAVIEIVLR
jgi:hypothetical protein